MVPLPLMQPRARIQNSCKIGSTQWNFMKQRPLFILKPVASYSKNLFLKSSEWLTVAQVVDGGSILICLPWFSVAANCLGHF